MPAPILPMHSERELLLIELEKARSELLAWSEKVEALEKETVKSLDGLTSGDPESAHGLADQCLIDFLRGAGFASIAEAYERAEKRVGFWYA